MPRLLLLLLLPITVAHADIYSYVDSRGVRHITNVPTGTRYQRMMATPSYRAPEPSRPVIVMNQPTTLPQDAPPMTTSNWIRWNLQSEVGLSSPNGATLLTPRGTPQRLNHWSDGWQRSAAARQARLSNQHPRHNQRWRNYQGTGVTGSRRPNGYFSQNRQIYSPHINRIAHQNGLDPALMHAVISAESSYNPRAVSPAGARGLMQLMPATAQRFGVRDSFDPIANMEGGAKYLRWLLNHFNGNVELALAGYNAGEGAVRRHGGIPPYRETQTYVRRVQQFYNHFRENG